jgi:hypothetical protein
MQSCVTLSQHIPDQSKVQQQEHIQLLPLQKLASLPGLSFARSSSRSSRSSS